jgi:P-type Ca2+ transporter type 2C
LPRRASRLRATATADSGVSALIERGIGPNRLEEVGLPVPPPGMTGLTTSEATALLAEHGPNRLIPTKRREFVPRWLWRAITDPMAILLLLAAPTYFLIGDTTDGVIALVALVPVAGVGWLLEARAARMLDSLRSLTSPTVVVWRDENHQRVGSEDLVPGDLMIVREGDVIAADADVVAGTQLMVDESALTGESQPITKTMGSGEAKILAGTTVVSGRGIARVAVTGMATQYGSIGALLADIDETSTPLQRAVGRLVRRLSVVAGAFCLLVVGVEVARGNGWGPAVIAAISLAIAAIPEEFPMVYTLYLGLGAWRLARERALVRRLSAVETLGSTTVICTDKTGTLTLGQMAVSSVLIADSTTVAGDDPRAASLLTAAVLACEPEPYDPLERAIVDLAARSGIDVERLHAGQFVRDYAFDPARKYLSHVWQHDGVSTIAAKGAIETLAEIGTIGANVTSLVSANDALARDGLRVLAVASGALRDKSKNRDDDETGLVLMGLIAFSDPVRAGVSEAVDQCRAAGIRLIMLTGDHPATAHAIAAQLGWPFASERGAEEIITGDQLDAIDDAALTDLIAYANVFARIRPEQKHRLIQALHARGEIVAMTGDGINDAPALREADIGVAMGQRGTEVARESAAMVLLDDNFATVVTAVRNGRRIFDNLVRAFAYLIAFHPPLLLAALIVPLTGRPLLLLPVHLVLLELVVHPVVSLVFENDPADAGIMTRPPRRPHAGLITRQLLQPLLLGLTLSVAVIGLYLGALARHISEDRARALAFVTLLLGQSILILVLRRDGLTGQRKIAANPVLLPIVVGIFAVTVAAVHVPAAAHILQLAPLGIVDWAVALAVAVVATCWSSWRHAGSNVVFTNDIRP